MSTRVSVPSVRLQLPPRLKLLEGRLKASDFWPHKITLKLNSFPGMITFTFTLTLTFTLYCHLGKTHSHRSRSRSNAISGVIGVFENAF